MATDGNIPNWVEAKLLDLLERGGFLSGDRGPVTSSLKLLNSDGLCSSMFRAVVESGRVRYNLMVKTLLNWRFDYYADMFINESRMYQEVLPGLLGGHPEVHPFIPKCYGAMAEPGEGVILMEDLSLQGFTHAPRTMDLEHICFSLKALGRFHALSYAAKKTDMPKFLQEIVHRIHGALKDEYTQFFMGMIIRESSLHAIQLFSTRFPEEADKHSDAIKSLKQMIDDSLPKMLSSALAQSPLAVVCHGDFTRNNLMFRYGEDGKISDVKFVDFQMSRYSSPVVDISSVICINTSPELRAAHLPDMLSAYHGGVVQSLSESLDCPPESLEGEFGLEAFQQEYRRGVLHGFCVASFFTQAALEGPGCIPVLGSSDTRTAEDVLQFLRDKRLVYSEEVNRRLAVLVKEVLDSNYLEPLISYLQPPE
ncbi:uncharacterized protein LOC134528618 [Bacillus rossius redtenbacheri]|uniref:uncharacterized protein LOC134528618 n=1 Tax=Bacillus rossius redtenbacheri TaxID=93214 RepID=UPI002FDDB79E